MPTTVIPNIYIGHAQNFEAATGCTVILTPQTAVCGVDQRGGAPGTRETDLLRPMHLIARVHAIVLAGGSAFGLSAADGVMRWLEERNIGVDVGVAHVPIVPTAVLFDLNIGRADIRPTAEMGYQACEQAWRHQPLAVGSVGVGTGATVGKVKGKLYAMKGGFGMARITLPDGIIIEALVAVNAFGDVIDPTNGQILAGVRDPETAQPFDTMAILRDQFKPPFQSVNHTVIGAVMTNARLNKEAANKVAQMAHNGLAKTIRPAHTMFDGDTIFALATGDIPHGDTSLIGAFAAEAMAEAVINGIQTAQSLAGVTAWQDVNYT